MRCILSTVSLLVTFCVFLCFAGTITLKGGEKILFVGNSLTDRGGGLNVAVQTLLGDASITVTTDANITAATELLDIFNQGNATAQILSGHYDIVVLQGWTNAEDYPTGSRVKLFQAVQKFDSVITSTGAKTVLYMTFPGIFQTETGLQNYSTIANVIACNYDTASRKIGNAPVAPCGLVYRTMVVAPPPGQTDSLLYADEIHPNNYGQLLSGYVFFKTLTGQSPIGLKQTFYSGANPKIDSVLQYRAESVTSTWITQHKNVTSTMERSAYMAGYSILNNTPSAPSYFLLDGSRFCPGVKMTNDRISRMYISRNGNNAVINYSVTGNSRR